jgi:putative oxidoreductase
MASEKTVHDRSEISWALLAVRVFVGSIFAVHGAQKLFGAFGGPGLSAIIQMMGPIGYLVTLGEFFGGLGLIVGFLPRFSAMAIIVIMLGAIATVHARFGFFMNWAGNQGGEGFEYHLLAIGALLPILIAGPGRFAFGRLALFARESSNRKALNATE